jgi:hypothetical protein
LGILGVGLEAPKTDKVFSERLGRVLGEPVRWFWCSGIVLGRDLGVGKVNILMVYNVFL